MMRKRFDFVQAVEVVLLRHGATQEGQYGWRLATIAGDLDIDPNPTWVNCRFADPKAAEKIITSDNFDHASGHWDWHYKKPRQKDADELERQFVSLLDPVQEAALHPLEKMSRELDAKLRAQGRKVILDSGEDSDEYLVVFPPNRCQNEEDQP
jgi:hypothetical protein